MNELHETEFKGQTLQARVTERKSPRRMAGSSGGNINVQRNIDFPLRILVQSDMVGAIIGRGGQTIRQITQQTRYKVAKYLLRNKRDFVITKPSSRTFSGLEWTSIGKTVSDLLKKPSQFMVNLKIVAMHAYKF